MKLNHKNTATRCLIAAMLAASPAIKVSAEDIDIFAGGSNTPAMPTIMLMLDSSSAWTSQLAADPDTGSSTKRSKFYHEVKTLKKILVELGKCDRNVVPNTVPDSDCQAPGYSNSVGNNLRLGLMMFAESGTNGGYVRYSARVMDYQNRLAFSNMLDGFIENGNGTDNSGTNRPLAKSFFELFKYYGGHTSPAKANQSGNNAGSPTSREAFGPLAYAGWGSDSGSDNGVFRRDYATNTLAKRSAVGYGASSAKSTFTNQMDMDYTSPIDDGCAKNFIIYISNAEATTGGDSGNPTANTLLANVGADLTSVKLPLTQTEASASLADEAARFLYQTDVSPLPGKQNVITYSVAVYDKDEETQNPTQQQIRQASSIARAGGGKYYAATDANSLLSSLMSILNEIQAVNSTFVTASLPVNTNAQGEFLNQVFIGMFRPGQDGPRWWGNVKQYRLACMLNGAEIADCKPQKNVADGALEYPVVQLVGANSPPKPIYENVQGFIGQDIASYWTTASTFWANDAKGTPPSASDLPDGPVVEKGGAAQRLREVYAASQATRKVLTCSTSSCSGALINFSTSGLATNSSTLQDQFFTSTSLVNPNSIVTFGSLNGSGKQTAMDNLINWIRGNDNAGDEKGPGTSGVNVRPSIHGDVIHSRPVAIDFGGSTGVVLFYGSNDGQLRAIKAAQTGTGAGNEIWSFIAPEFYGRLNRLRVNSPQIRLDSTPAGITPTPLRKDYFWDGPISAFKPTKGSLAGKTILYVTTRRGGRMIYALDVTDINAPTVLWKIVGGTTTGFEKLGMTFSTPTIIQTRYRSRPVLVFGGGYAGGYDSSTGAGLCEDASPRGNVSNSPCNQGPGLYIVNPETGALITYVSQAWDNTSQIDLQYGIAGDVAPMDSDFDGYIDRLYASDLGGNLLRFDFDAPPEVSGSIVNDTVLPVTGRVLAKFGTDKKLFFRPSVVQLSDKYGIYTNVAIGSGDREKPLLDNTQDYFYTVKDRGISDMPSTTRITPMTASSLCSFTSSSSDANAKLTPESGCTDAVNYSATDKQYNGWYIQLQVGEKVVNAPRVAFNVLNFATNLPSTEAELEAGGVCSNLGKARSYQLDVTTGVSEFNSALYAEIVGGGLPPTSFIGTVNITSGGSGSGSGSGNTGVRVPVIIGGGLGDGNSNDCVGPTCAQSKNISIPANRKRIYRYNAVKDN